MTIEFIGYSTLGGAQVNLDYCPICDTYIHVPCLAVLSCACLNCPVFLNDFPIWIRSDNEPDPQTTIIRPLSYMWGPTCGVAAGRRCVLHSGASRSAPHADRKLEAKRVHKSRLRKS